MQYHAFKNKSQLNAAFCEKIIQILKSALKERSEAYLVVSGGRAPQEYFPMLATADLDWGKVTVLLADERCVDSGNVNSNEYLVRRYLLQSNASKARFIAPLFAKEEEALLRQAVLNETLKTLPRFDAVILGMGEDGHTASLFPLSPNIREGLSDTCLDAVMVTQPVTAPYLRLSMTKKRLRETRHLFLYLLGEEKREVLNQAQAADDPVEMPIRAFLKTNDPEICVMFAPNLS